MYQIAQIFALRIILSFTICAVAVVAAGVSLLSEASQGQGAGRNARQPRHEKA